MPNKETLPILTPGWPETSALRPLEAALIEYLSKRRYAASTIAAYLSSVAHFAQWAHLVLPDLSGIDVAAVNRFLRTHLCDCSCSPRMNKGLHNARAALKHMLMCKAETEAEPRQTGQLTPVASELDDYLGYLRRVCGVAQITCQYHLKHVGNFLRGLFGESPVDITRVSPTEVDAFMSEMGERWTASSLGVIRSSLRSYLRFKAVEGYNVHTLLVSMPVLANWKRQRPPNGLTDKQMGAFLESFDQSSPTGQRDYAIARCCLDLGLRGCEVTTLSLDAINWRTGVVTIVGSKARRVRQLPLPCEVGRAIAQYLRSGRPQTANRAVFVRHRAPYDVPLTTAAIRNCMNYAFVRSGLRASFCNTHVLRRTLAQRLQRAGSSIKEIADVLRQDSVQAATSYTRADIDSLRSVALAWAGVQS